MMRLLNIEYRILSRYRTFLILLSLYFIFLALVSYGFGNFLGDFSFNNGDQPIQLNLSALPIYRFPDIWHNMTYIASYFKFILAILVIMFISNEFEFRTLRQHVIDGMSRGEFVQSKFLSIALISLLSTLFIALVILILGFTHDNGTDAFSSMFSGSIFILAYFVQIFAFMIFACLIAVLLKRTGLSVIVLLLWTFIIENIIAYNLPDSLDVFLPVKSMNNLIQFPFFKYVNFGQEIQSTVELSMFALPIAYSVLSYFLITLILNKRDL